MGENPELEAMHRRAQKSEGALQSALYEVETWQSVLSNKEPVHWLARKVLDDIKKSLERAAE